MPVVAGEGSHRSFDQIKCLVGAISADREAEVRDLEQSGVAGVERPRVFAGRTAKLRF